MREGVTAAAVATAVGTAKIYVALNNNNYIEKKPYRKAFKNKKYEHLFQTQ